MIKFHGLQHPPPPGVSHMFLLFLETSTVMSGARKVMLKLGKKTKHTIHYQDFINPAMNAVLSYRHQIESGLGGGLAYVGLSSKYDRNMSGSCKEISWICFFVTVICNWVQIFLGIKSKFEKKILLSSLQR